MVPTFVKSRSKKHTTPTRTQVMEHLPNGIVSWNSVYFFITMEIIGLTRLMTASWNTRTICGEVRAVMSMPLAEWKLPFRYTRNRYFPGHGVLQGLLGQGQAGQRVSADAVFQGCFIEIASDYK